MGDGEAGVEDLPYGSDCLMNGPHPAHPRMVFDQPLPIVGKGHAPALVKTGVIGRHDDRDGGVQCLLELQESGLVRLQ